MKNQDKYSEALERAKAWLEGTLSPETTLPREVIELIFPELKESEDERMLREIINYVREQGNKPTGLPNGTVPVADMIAYLEKQKEIPMPSSTELIEMWDKEKTMLEEKDFRGDEWRLAYTAYMDGFAEGAHIKLEKQKEQKPAEWSEEDETTISEIEFAVMQMRTERQDTKNKCLSFLKSLRPQPRARKRDYATPNKEFFSWIYERLINVHKENPNVDYMLSFKERIEELSFDESHWKPTEEQMEALKKMVESRKIRHMTSVRGDNTYLGLNSLYSDLQKLMQWKRKLNQW